MSTEKRITEALEGALRLPLTPQSRYILMSDCHRGTGNANDNFLKNEYLYLAALQYYFAGNFTYIELGDGDELWENRSLCRIKEAHTESFFSSGRLLPGRTTLYALRKSRHSEKAALFCPKTPADLLLRTKAVRNPAFSRNALLFRHYSGVWPGAAKNLPDPRPSGRFSKQYSVEVVPLPGSLSLEASGRTGHSRSHQRRQEQHSEEKVRTAALPVGQ